MLVRQCRKIEFSEHQVLIGPYNSAYAYSAFLDTVAQKELLNLSGRTLTSEGGLGSSDEEKLLALA